MCATELDLLLNPYLQNLIYNKFLPYQFPAVCRLSSWPEPTAGQTPPARLPYMKRRLALVYWRSTGGDQHDYVQCSEGYYYYTLYYEQEEQIHFWPTQGSVS